MLSLEQIRYRIQNNTAVREMMQQAKMYYNNQTAIKEKGVKQNSDDPDPLRTADNRIGHNYHEILVDEKAAYVFTYPVIFDIDGDKDTNEQVQEILGDDFTRKAKNLCIEASNCGTAWLHYWIEEEQKFKYELVESDEIIPVYDNGLERKLEAIIRCYTLQEYVGMNIAMQPFTYIEYWDKVQLTRWKIEGASSIGHPMLTEEIQHTFGEVPFIEFANNSKKQSDLSRYKDLIDLYDRVMSGFANDLEDIQQIIYILENYGGQDLGEFLGDLKRYKAIKTDSDPQTGAGGGVKTLQIEIPTEARKVILEILEKKIYEAGQGLQQDVESVGNASGVALKFFYRKLELKSGLLETEFRTSFALLIKAIMRFIGKESRKISQTYTRNMISNDLEDAQIAKMSAGVIPDELIRRRHPWVDDPLEAEELMKQEHSQEFEYERRAGGGVDE